MLKGSKHTPETRRKMSEAHRGGMSPMLGKKHSLESRQKMSKARSGKKLSLEHRKKIGEAHRGEKGYWWGKKLSLEHRRKISEANKGKQFSLETRQKISDALRGEKHPNWKGGRIYRRGYILILSPNHPNRNVDGRVQEHRLVMEECLGRYLKPWEVVHHINGIKDDNRIENLELLPHPANHVVRLRMENLEKENLKWQRAFYGMMGAWLNERRLRKTHA